MLRALGFYYKALMVLPTW